MDISKGIADIAVFLEYFSAKSNFLEQLLQKLEKSMAAIGEQLITISVIAETQLPLDVLEKHPCIVKKVSYCLSSLIEDEVCEMNRLMPSLKEMVTNFAKMYRKIELYTLKIDWSEISHSIYSVFVNFTEWIEKCWKYFHIVHLNISGALQMIHFDRTLSNDWFKNIFKYEVKEKNQIFNHPVIEMFSLLNKEKLTSEKVISF